MDPARICSRIRVVLPENVGIALYCSFSCKLTSAGAAVVWVLVGGLAAWKKEGLPATVHWGTPSEVTGALGKKIIEIDSGATL